MTDLRLVCGEAKDYSEVSSIEPSGQGGAKIAAVITEVIVHDLSLRRGSVYW